MVNGYTRTRRKQNISDLAMTQAYLGYNMDLAWQKGGPNLALLKVDMTLH